MSRITTAVGAVLALAAAPAALAAEDAGFYAGVGVGQFNVSISDFESGLNFSDGDTAFRLFGGWQFNQYFGMELGYVDGGSASETIGDIATDLVEADVAIDVAGVDLFLTGNVPLGESFFLYGKAGMMSWDADIDATVRMDDGEGGVITTTESDSESDEDLAYGAGFGFNMGDNASVLVEYMIVDIRDTDVDYWTANLLWRFR